VTETPDQTKKHIAVLTEFETKYGKYIRALEEDWTASVAAGTIGAPDDLGSDMSADEFARLTREVQMLAARADRAIKASGVAPVSGSGDLPSQAFDFEVNDGYFSNDGMEFPRELLELIPSQISGLEIKLEEAEAAEEESAKRLFGETVLHSMDAAKGRQLAREQRPPKEMEPWPSRKRPWHENPWLVAIGSGIVLLAVTLLVTQT
jgi:hypothetical protein